MLNLPINQPTQQYCQIKEKNNRKILNVLSIQLAHGGVVVN